MSIIPRNTIYHVYLIKQCPKCETEEKEYLRSDTITNLSKILTEIGKKYVCHKFRCEKCNTPFNIFPAGYEKPPGMSKTIPDQ